MTRIAYLVSSAHALSLDDDSAVPAGCCAVDAVTAYERLDEAGLDVAVISPDGRPPTADADGQSWFFHIPKADQDYLASVVRTFATDSDGIRVTREHVIELGLVAARRIAALVEARGTSASEAHTFVSSAARTAWRDGRPLVEVVSEYGEEAPTAARARAALDAVRAEAETSAGQREARLRDVAGFQEPLALSSLTNEDLAGFDALVVPGGHGAMADLADSPDVRRLLVDLHTRDAPIATVGHGAAVLLSARERADGLWLFDGYRMTSVTDEEEDQAGSGRGRPAWRMDVALQDAGGVFDDGPAAWASHVVVDRNLVTGQNSRSTDATIDALLRLLQRAPSFLREPGVPSQPSGRTAPRSVMPEETVRSLLDAVAGHDLDTVAQLLDPRVSVTVHPLHVADTGPEALLGVLADLLHAFPDLLVTVGRVITTGNVVTALVRVGGTQAADYAGVASTSKYLDVDQAWRFEVADGLVTDVAAYWCQAQVYRRLAVRRYDEIAIA